MIFAETDTSRPPRVLEENGKNYWFSDREEMEEEIRKNHFLESGEHNGNLYGTHLDTVRDIIKQGSSRSTRVESLRLILMYPKRLQAKCAFWTARRTL